MYDPDARTTVGGGVGIVVGAGVGTSVGAAVIGVACNGREHV